MNWANGEHMKKNMVKIMPLCVVVLLLAGLVLVALPTEVLAQVPNIPAPKCTIDQQMQPINTGIVSTVVNQVHLILDAISQQMYNGIIGNVGFRSVVYMALTLYVLIYGVMFTFGMVEMTLHDFSMRMIKIGIIAILFQPNSFQFFSDSVVRFFNCGTDDIINKMVSLTALTVGQSEQALAAVGTCEDSASFQAVDEVVALVFSQKMLVTLLGLFFTGPYGLMLGALVLIGFKSFLMALVTAVWVYIMALVIKALLFGLAPLFIVCLLFQRTRHLFQGWLGQVINASLQPILLFTFFAFFINLIGATINNIMQTPFCWTETTESVRGTPFDFYWWRPQIPTGQTDANGNPTFESFGGTWGFEGPIFSDDVSDDFTAPIFPIDPLMILIFLILTELASRFNGVVTMIASDIASASSDLSSMQSSFSNIMGGIGKKGGGDAGGGGGAKTAERSGPGVGKPGEALTDSKARAAPGAGERTDTDVASNSTTAPKNTG